MSLVTNSSNWHRSLAAAVRDPDVLIDRLGLPDALRPAARQAVESFPLLVPESYLARMTPGDPGDPLLLQVLPLADELRTVPGFTSDPVGDADAREAPGLLHKYEGRMLLVATGACAVHCRYCFRRHYPYGDEPRRLDDWEPAMQAIAEDASVREVILSGGDPLILADSRLAALIGRLDAVPHLRRLRIHSRLPIVLPDRVTSDLLDLLTASRLQPIVVVHANHSQELVADCAEAVRRIVRAGVPTLNQAVLLRGINDSAAIQSALCERLVDLGAMPYYLHQLDRVAGAAHFEVSPEEGLAIIAELRDRLPGYAVPRYVRELPGATSKSPIV
ncbi:MAG: EF-P beta-lysylation protein EpmB [Planctomycetales bacterium]